VLGINEPAVTIKNIEVAIIDRGWDEGWVPPSRREGTYGQRVAVIGSGPAGSLRRRPTQPGRPRRDCL